MFESLGLLILSLATPLAGATGLPQEPEAATPAPERGLKTYVEKAASDGFTLFSPLRSRTSFLVDMQGAVVHRWVTEFAPGNSEFLLPNGRLLRCARLEDNPVFHGGGIGGRIQEFDRDGKVTWDFTVSTRERMHHHDIRPMPNGNVLLIVWEHRTREEAIARGRDADQVGEQGLWPDAILEIEPVRPDGGKIVWAWHAWDHLVQDRDREKPGYGKLVDHPGRIDVNAGRRVPPAETEKERREREELEARMRSTGYAGGRDPADAGPPERRPGPEADWLHTNSVDFDVELDLVLLSSPRLSEIFVIDHSTTTAEAATAKGGRFGRGGEILWRWGNPKNYGAGGEAEQRLFSQHDARWVRHGDDRTPRVTVFNNGGKRPGGDRSSVDEIVTSFGSGLGFVREAGKPFGPAEPTWTYTQEKGFFASFISGAQRLENGNTLVVDGPGGRIFEVTREGGIVWDYLNPFGGEVEPSMGRAGGPEGTRRAGRGVPPTALFRATRIARDHPGLAQLRR